MNASDVCQRIHCSYHKCLTSYFSNVLGRLCERSPWLRDGYRHYRSRVDLFEVESAEYRVVSVNNHALDFSKLDANTRVTRFIRDPRDLVVSGYFYHKRGAEPWCDIVDPSTEDWRGVNGHVPKALPAGESFSSWLSSIDLESGLLAELEFRRHHFESMLEWPDNDERVRLFYYEDILGHERETFAQIFGHYGLNVFDRFLGRRIAGRLALSDNRRGGGHVRNPRPGQWRDHFTPLVERTFNDFYAEVLEKYGFD